jgi:hypothetical protein
MRIEEVLKSQFHASLKMLGQAIAGCPESLWDDRERKNRFWHICYHTLFYTHMYLQDSEKDFIPWAKHRDNYNYLGPLPWPPHENPKIEDPYTKEEILEYFEVCEKQVDERIPIMNLGDESGFFWLPFRKMELQFYNIRHIQHHVGQLYDRLTGRRNVKLEWVDMDLG